MKQLHPLLSSLVLVLLLAPWGPAGAVSQEGAGTQEHLASQDEAASEASGLPEGAEDIDWPTIPQCTDTSVTIDAPGFADMKEQVRLHAVLEGPGTFAGLTYWRLTDHGGGVVKLSDTLDIEHAYDRSGGHMVLLRTLVRGPDGEMCQAAARTSVRVKFVQGFQFDVQAECDQAVAGHDFTCRANFPGEVTQTVCQWTFVPGQDPVVGQEVQYMYDEPGTYTVFLQAKQLNPECLPMGVCVKNLSLKIPVRPAEPE